MLPAKSTEIALKTNLEAVTQSVPGLTYVPDYINVEVQQQLLNLIDQQEWSIKSGRRVQHYGYQYDYHNGLLASTRDLGDLPEWLSDLANRFANDGLIKTVPDQVIVNEYQPGQGIVSHIDCIPCFGQTIITLSLNSPCVIDFTQPQTQENAAILLLPGSLLIFQKAARYIWQHGIAARSQDEYQGKAVVRTRRVSLTFREVLFPYK